MRKLLILSVVLTVVLAGISYGALTYDSDAYLTSAFRGSGGTLDPIYLNMAEVEDLLEMTTAWGSFYFAKTDTVPTAAEGNMYFDDSENCPKYYNGSSWVALTSGTGDNTLDNAYDQGGAGSGKKIDADSGAVEIEVDAQSNNGALLLDCDDTNNLSVLQITNVGTGTGAISIDIDGQATGRDIEGTGASWHISGAGAATLGSTLSVGGNITLENGLVLSQAANNWSWTENSETVNWAFGDNALTLSSTTGVTSLDFGTIAPTFGSSITATGGMSSSDDITLANGKALQSSTTTGQTIKLRVYDNDTGPGYKDALTLTNGNTPSMSLGGNAMTVAIDSTDWDISATGAMTGIGAITADGLITGSLGVTITGATASLNASSNFGTNICTGTSTGAVAIGGGNGTFAVASTGLDISTGGALTNAASIAGTNSNTINLAIDNRFEFTDNSETFGFDVGTTSNTVELTTDSGIDTIDCNDVDKFTDIESLTGDNGSKIDLSIDERVEFSDGAEKIGFILSGANKIELCTDSGADTLDFNDIDDLEDIQEINGDNGQKTDYSIDNRIEWGDNSETFGVDFTTADTLTLTTDSDIATVEVNDLDAWTGFESITGEGTGALGGFLKTVTNDSDGKVLTVAESGTVQTNASAGGAAAWTLPAAAAGLEYTFVVMAAQELRVTPAAGDKIVYGATVMDAAEYYYADAVGESLHIVAVDATNWVMTTSTGTWAEQNP